MSLLFNESRDHSEKVKPIVHVTAIILRPESKQILFRKSCVYYTTGFLNSSVLLGID